LQSALGVAQLRTVAFEAWTTLIKCLGQETVESMLQSTFSTIISNWDAFDKASKERAEELFDYLVATHPDMLRRNIDLLPRLNNLTGFGQQAQKLESLRIEVPIPHKFQKFCERLAHQHASVLEQALSELSDYLQKQQGYLQASATSEQPDKVVGELLRSILDACVRFGNNNPRIARLSAECIGKIGCVDSNRVEAVREHKNIVVLSNFGNAEDTTNFVLFLLEEVLVKAFLSATNPKAQGFFSYVMQELLTKCDFRMVFDMYRKNGDLTDAAKALYEKWLNLPESVQMTLSPFLTSKYTVTAMSRNDVSYPIFQPDKSFNVWLRAFVLDLLEKPYNTNAIFIFDPLCRVIKIQDTSAANFLLPYVVLHSIVLGPDEERENISNELQRILSHAAQSGSHQEVNNLKLCSEVNNHLEHDFTLKAKIHRPYFGS
jgi:serine/threonine-protein kinase ATR